MFYPLTVRDFLDRAEQRLSRPGRGRRRAGPAGARASVSSPTARWRHWPGRRRPVWTNSACRSAAGSRSSRRTRRGCSPRSSGCPAGGGSSCRSTSGWPPPEIEYIVRHSGAQVVFADPALKDVLDAARRAAQVRARRRRRAVPARRRAAAVGPNPTRPRPPRSTTPPGTTARPKGVQLTHRNLWLNATVFGLHTTISDRDVLLHTLPMFHANGWGMPYGVTGVGGRHIVLRQVDGAEILRRVRRHGVTLMCAAPAVVNAVLDAAAIVGGRDPGPRTRCASWSRALRRRPARSSGSWPNWAGSSARSTA